MELNDLNQPRLELTPASLNFLRDTAKWAKFLAIIGFVCIGIMVIVAFFAGTLFGMMGEKYGMPFPPAAMFTALYLVLAVIYFFPVYYLFRFSNYLQTALNTSNTTDLNLALENLKAHYRYIGILMIILLSFYAIILFFSLVVGGLAHMGH